MYGNDHMFRSRPTDHHQRLLCGVPHSGSVRVFLRRAVVSRVRVSDSRVLYEPVIFGSFFFGDFLEISGDLPFGRLGFFFSAAPGNGGVACCARVGKFCAFWKPVVFVLPSRM